VRRKRLAEGGLRVRICAITTIVATILVVVAATSLIIVTTTLVVVATVLVVAAVLIVVAAVLVVITAAILAIAVAAEPIALSERVSVGNRKVGHADKVDLLDGLQDHSTPGRRGQQRAGQRQGKRKRS